MIEVKIFKGLGVKVGILDVLILWCGVFYGIEFKVFKGYSSVD